MLVNLGFGTLLSWVGGIGGAIVTVTGGDGLVLSESREDGGEADGFDGGWAGAWDAEGTSGMDENRSC